MGRNDAGEAKTRDERLAEALRANLARRKEQGRARRQGAADERREGVAVKDAGDAPKQDGE